MGTWSSRHEPNHILLATADCSGAGLKELLESWKDMAYTGRIATVATKAIVRGIKSRADLLERFHCRVGQLARTNSIAGRETTRG